MLGVVFASQADLARAVVAAESWRTATTSGVAVLVEHPDLVTPFARALPDAQVVSSAELDVAPGMPGAALSALLDRQSAGTIVVALPATAFVLGRPDPLVEAAERAGVAVAVRGRGPLPVKDGLRPTATDIAGLGPLHPGVLALRAGDDRATDLLRWWDATPAEERASLIPVRRREVALVDAPSVGAGWWNLGDRLLERTGDALLIDGDPASIVDFDGWDPLHEHMLHPDMTRLMSSGDPALRWLVARYAARRGQAAERVPGGTLPVWPQDEQLASLLDAAPEALRASAVRDEPGAREAFCRWAEQTDPEDTVWGLSRYLLAFRRARYEDLQLVFADVNDYADAHAYLDWARRDGVAQGVPARYVGPVPQLDAVPPAAATSGEPEGAGAGGVNLVGFFDEPALGVAEIARQVRDGLRAAGVPVAVATVDRRGRPSAAEGDAPLPHAVTVFCVNADLLPVVHRRLRRRLPEHGRLVGLWWWELGQLPESWQPALDLVDEVWAGTRFVAAAFASSFAGPVRAVPLGLGHLAPAGAAPEPVRADPRPYVLLTFDYASRVERKNPLAGVEAFVRSGGAPDVRLVVKTVNGTHWPREHERVRLAAADAGRRDVLLLDEAVTAAEQAAIVAGAAAYLSLHRSEGLGLTIVEAMLRRVPVVATDFGGSTDVLDSSTGWPVPYAPGAVPDGCEPYPAGAPWAEPDVEAAASALREVLGGGPAVEERVAAALAQANRRAERICGGIDLADAVAAAYRTADAASKASSAGRRLRDRLRGARG